VAITSLSIRRTGRSSVRLLFESDLPAPTFYVWRDGLYQGATSADHWDATVPFGAHPVWDVFDDPDEEPELVLPDHLRLQWAAVSGADHYRVEELVGENWAQRARVASSGRGYYHYHTPRLADGETHQWRIVAVGADGNESTAASFTAVMARYPDPPAATYDYDEATGLVTITVS